jgi:hypothetical protein
MAGPGKSGPVGHVPTKTKRRRVMLLSSFGLPHDQICRVMEISKPTLYKHYQDDLDFGMAQANAGMANRLYRIAMSDDRSAVSACIFWLKAKGGWSERQQIDVNDVSAPKSKAEARAMIAKAALEFGAKGIEWDEDGSEPASAEGEDES